MKRIILASFTATLIGLAGVSAAAPPPAAVGNIDVMTQNQYIGADLNPLIGAIGTDGFNAAVIETLEQIADGRVADRVKKLASEISTRKPHIVGLQEAWELACIPAVPELGGYPCNDPRIAGAFEDHLALMTAALGASYHVAAVGENFVVDSYGPYPGIPFFLDGPDSAPGFVQVIDRDAILARADVPTSVYKYPCTRPMATADGCNYEVDLPLAAIGSSVKRGFIAVNATVAGKAYRVVNTHLEQEAGGPIPGEIQAAQAFQLFSTVLNPALTSPDLRLIIVGDFNSSPDDPASSLPTPYMQLTAAGLFDAWLLRPGNVAGLSCCQDANLLNRVSHLYRRVDLILTREMPRSVKNARLIGEVAADRLPPQGRGLWPSDHAAVAAGLQY